MTKLREWVTLARDSKASDLHLETGTPLVLRVRGELNPYGEKIPAEVMIQAVREALDDHQWQEFIERKSGDLSKTIAGTRCRINVFQTIRGIGMAIRLLSSFQNNLND